MHTLRSIYIIWYREILRWWRDRSRIVGSFAMPILMLFIFGSGLSPAMGNLTANLPLGEGEQTASGGVDFVQFIFPGTIGMTVLMMSLMSGISIVWDREFGFLREILVAPVSRTAVALGKVLGGSTLGIVQGLLLLVLAPLVGISVTPYMVTRLIPLLFLASFAMTSLGVLVAAQMRSIQGFQMLMQFLTMPMIFLSGALFPMRNLPSWMNILVKINPVTYAVDPLRRVVFEAQDMPEMVLRLFPQMGLGVEIFGHAMTIRDDVLVIGIFGAAMVFLAIWMFNRQEE